MTRPPVTAVSAFTGASSLVAPAEFSGGTGSPDGVVSAPSPACGSDPSAFTGASSLVAPAEFSGGTGSPDGVVSASSPSCGSDTASPLESMLVATGDCSTSDAVDVC